MGCHSNYFRQYYDIEQIIGVIMFSTDVLYEVDEQGRKAFYLHRQEPNGAYNLLKMYSNKKECRGRHKAAERPREGGQAGGRAEGESLSLDAAYRRQTLSADECHCQLRFRD